MAERGIRREADVLDLLASEGFKVSQSGFNGWLYGKYGVNKDFPSAFAEALDLDEEQKRRLAMAFAFGQNKRLTADDL
jgi:hypothetical protein